MTVALASAIDVGGGAGGNLSGIAMPVGNLASGQNNSIAGHAWTQFYTEDFNNLTHVNINPYGVVKDTTGNGLRDGPDTVTQSVSTLYIGCRTGVVSSGSYAGQTWPLGAVVLPTVAGVAYSNGQLYGRYDFCCRMDSIYGFKLLHLLWPDSENWPQDGEIDYPENNSDVSVTYAAYPASIGVGGATHPENAASGSQQDTWAGNYSWLSGQPSGATVANINSGVIYNPRSWHIYTVEWTPSAMYYYVDYAWFHTDTTAVLNAAYSGTAVPNTKMHPVLQIETSTTGEVPNGSSGYFQCDWWVAYSY